MNARCICSLLSAHAQVSCMKGALHELWELITYAKQKFLCTDFLKGMEKTIQVEGGLLHTSVFPHLEQLAGTGRSVRL